MFRESSDPLDPQIRINRIREKGGRLFRKACLTNSNAECTLPYGMEGMTTTSSAPDVGACVVEVKVYKVRVPM